MNKDDGTCNVGLERVVDDRLREIVDIDGMQFGFMKGKGARYAIWLLRQIQEKIVRIYSILLLLIKYAEKSIHGR